jgi:predicted transcriptional regulator
VDTILNIINKRKNMAKGERFTIIVKKKLKDDLQEVALQEGTTPSEFAREAIENKVKRLLKKDK